MPKVVSLDISSTNVGFCVADVSKSSANLVSCGVISAKGNSKERIYSLAKNLIKIIDFNKIDLLVLEAFFGHSTKGAMVVPEAKGAIVQEILTTIKKESMPYVEIIHSSAKKGIVGAGNADKQTVLDFINKNGKITDSFDCADAIINLMFYATIKNKLEPILIIKKELENENSKTCKGKFQNIKTHNKHRVKNKKATKRSKKSKD